MCAGDDCPYAGDDGPYVGDVGVCVCFIMFNEYYYYYYVFDMLIMYVPMYMQVFLINIHVYRIVRKAEY